MDMAATLHVIRGFKFDSNGQLLSVSILTTTQSRVNPQMMLGRADNDRFNSHDVNFCYFFSIFLFIHAYQLFKKLSQGTIHMT